MKTSRPGASSLRIVAAFLCAIGIAPATAQIQLQAPADPPPQPQPQQQQPQQQQRPAQTPRQQPPARPAQPAQQQAPAAPQQPLQPRLPQFPTELPAPGAMFVILDGRLIMSQSNAALALRQQAERQNQMLRTDVQKQEEEFRNAQAELQRQQRGQVPQDQLEKRARDLQKRMSDAQTKLQERTRALDRVFAEAEQRIYQAMIQATVELAQERNYQVIFDKAQVVVVQNQYDVTGEILNRVNQRLPSVQLQMPAN
jgi:Skp family chaperone for outer membrane proteins